MSNVFFFIEHIWDIWRISAHKDVDVGVAYAMFMADVRTGEAHEYNSDMPEIGYDKLKPEYDALVAEDKLSEAIEVYHKFEHPEYFNICKLWKAENKEGLDAKVEAFKAAYLAGEVEE